MRFHTFSFTAPKCKRSALEKYSQYCYSAHYNSNTYRIEWVYETSKYHKYLGK